MTVALAPATCPRCGTVDTIFIRSDDGSDLVCWGDAVSSIRPKSEEPSQSPQQVFREGVKPSRGLSDLAAPSRRTLRRIP